VRDG
jgi:hypothetical protein